MGVRNLAAWLVLLTLLLVLASSCESGGNYRQVDYRFGVGSRWSGYGGSPWGYYPVDRPDIGEPIAVPLSSMGMPDMGDAGLGGFD